jgi:hypothetical protein
VRLAATTVIAGLPLIVLLGCGDARTPVPSLTNPAAPHGFRLVRYPGAGVSFKAPGDWLVTRQQPPGVAITSSGSAVVAVWRFPRSATAPAGAAALEHARSALIGAARSRDSTLQLIRANLVRVAGAPAVELDAFERIAGQPRRVRSIHVYVAGGELVVDEYAPASTFHAVDHQVFSPLKRSLALSPAPAAQ